MYECAIKVREKLGATNSPTFVKTLANLAQVYDNLDAPEKAEMSRQRIREVIDNSEWGEEEKQALRDICFPDVSEVCKKKQ